MELFFLSKVWSTSALSGFEECRSASVEQKQPCAVCVCVCVCVKEREGGNEVK